MRPVTPSIVIALGLVLAGCGPVNRATTSVNQPVVSRTDYAFDLRTDGRGLGAGEAQRLAGWFDSVKLGYGDHVAVDDPANSGAARDAVAAVAAHYGLLLDSTAPITQGAPEAGTLRVVVSRTSAAVAHCPNWDRRSQPEPAGSTMSNFGCANNSNLAAMVADPEDLIRGREGNAGTDGRVAIKAISVYRDADPTGKPGTTIGAANTNTKGGN